MLLGHLALHRRLSAARARFTQVSKQFYCMLTKHRRRLLFRDVDSDLDASTIIQLISRSPRLEEIEIHVRAKHRAHDNEHIDAEDGVSSIILHAVVQCHSLRKLTLQV